MTARSSGRPVASEAEPEAFGSVVGSPDALLAAERSLSAQGWIPRRGWSLAEQPWSHRMSRIVCLGAVDDPRSARDALAACARAAGIVVDVGGCPAPLRARFVDDLGRLALAPVPGRAAPRITLPLTPEQRALLALVAEGASVPEAADQLFLSRRTAERRMAAVRSALGVTSTAAAVARLRQAGVGGLWGSTAAPGALP